MSRCGPTFCGPLGRPSAVYAVGTESPGKKASCASSGAGPEKVSFAEDHERDQAVLFFPKWANSVKIVITYNISLSLEIAKIIQKKKTIL